MPISDPTIFMVWPLYIISLSILRRAGVRTLFNLFFITLNIMALYICFFSATESEFIFPSCLTAAVGIVVSFISIRTPQLRKASPYISVLAPFIMLILFRHFSYLSFFGIAFICIRLSHIAFEVNFREVEPPSILDFLNYIFFFPTVIMGPITPFENFKNDLAFFKPKIDMNEICRFIFGLTKVFSISSIVYKLSFDTLAERASYSPLEWISAGIFAYIAIYIKFSGICDVVITSAGFIGFHVDENFNRPLFSRNPQDHWKRWHVSLVTYFRDVFYYPLSFYLQKKFEAKFESIIVIALTYFLFTFIALWHGPKLEYLLFAWYHATGVSWIYLYNKLLRKHLGKNIEKYLASNVAHFFAWFLTLIYIGFSYIIYNYPVSFWFPRFFSM